MPKSKKFIDRKSAVTFSLVHRSQRDPLIADETAPQRVLVPINATIQPSKDKQPELTAEQRRAEQQKYGIYFDDDYNYLQHLRDTKEVTMLLQPKSTHKRKAKADEPTQESEENKRKATDKLTLPSSVFASEVEEDVGLLNKAAPQGLRLDLDPDVVAALDEDFDFDNPDNVLEDNFIEMAMAEGSGSEEEYSDEDDMSQGGGSERSFASDQEYGSEDDESQDNERGGRGRMPEWDQFGGEETKSRFSQYSMSSSVIRRNEGLNLLDRRFEKMFAEYDDTEVGALDCEDIEGSLPHTDSMLLDAARELQDERQHYKPDKEKEIARIVRLQEIAEESSASEMETIEVRGKEKWDCESILSTYSNLYNHPKLIEEPKSQKIQISKKTGIPVDVLNDSKKLTAKTLARFNAQQNETDSDEDAKTQATVLSTLSVLSIRHRDETPEEKRDRKRLLKEYRKERRLEKKANKEAFKEEKKCQEKILLNNKCNIQGKKIL